MVRPLTVLNSMCIRRSIQHVLHLVSHIEKEVKDDDQLSGSFAIRLFRAVETVWSVPSRVDNTI